MNISARDTAMPVSLVTGGSRGLGRCLVQALAERGFSVVFNYLSSVNAAGETVRSAGDSVHAVRADIGDMPEVMGMADMIRQRFGRLDAVIHNAGIARDSLLLRQTETEWDEVIKTNLRGCFNVIKAAAPLMIQSGGGHIIVVSSYSGLKGKQGQAAYSASKAALVGLAHTAARELSEHRIRVNTVLPGYMMTDMGSGSRKGSESAASASINGAFSDPASVAQFMLWLLGTVNVTGQVFSLDSRIL